MIFTETAIAGAWILTPERRDDKRGFFARVWCERELAQRGLETRVAQCSVSWNRQRGTLRGLHYQIAPHEEVKLVRCTRGAVYDVIVDLRPASPSVGRHAAIELTAENRLTLYIPKGFAHGFQTLDDDTEMFYKMSEFHAPDAGRGARWDDPAFGISWPISEPILNERDRSYPDIALARR